MNIHTKRFAVFFAFILLLGHGVLGDEDRRWYDCDCTNKYLAAAAGGATLVGGAAYFIAAAGFGPAGIAAASLASKMMSLAATTGYGGAIVGGLQSAGAAGLGLGTKAALGAAGAAAGYTAGDCDCRRK